VQFLTGIRAAAAALGGDKVQVPQQGPLSGGEVLGCTSPEVTTEAFVFVADGRFHLEATMIRNPTALAFRYDPYAKKLTRESYDFREMTARRRRAIAAARNASSVGVVLGTLGRQGSPAILHRIKALLRKRRKRSVVVLASELDADLLDSFASVVDAWIQIACPRLSIDWGQNFCGGDNNGHNKPLLSPYEAFLAFDDDTSHDDTDNWDYRMDFYAKDGGPWSNYYYEEK